MDELSFNHVEFRYDADGDLEIELIQTDKEQREHGYQGRFLSPEQTALLRKFLNRTADSAGEKHGG